jgi:hypothetical protein
MTTAEVLAAVAAIAAPALSLATLLLRGGRRCVVQLTITVDCDRDG